MNIKYLRKYVLEGTSSENLNNNNFKYKSAADKKKRKIPSELKVAGGWICK